MSLPKPKIASVPFDGVTYYVRGIKGSERRNLMAGIDGSKTLSEVRLVAMGMCDESGALRYDFENAEHIAELDEADGAFIGALAAKLMELCGLTKAASDDAEKK